MPSSLVIMGTTLTAVFPWFLSIIRRYWLLSAFYLLHFIRFFIYFFIYVFIYFFIYLFFYLFVVISFFFCSYCHVSLLDISSVVLLTVHTCVFYAILFFLVLYIYPFILQGIHLCLSSLPLLRSSAIHLHCLKV